MSWRLILRPKPYFHSRIPLAESFLHPHAYDWQNIDKRGGQLRYHGHQAATVGGVLYRYDWHTCLKPSNPYSSNRFCPSQLPTMFTTLSRRRCLFPQSLAPAGASFPLETCNSSPLEICSSLQVGKFAVEMLLGRCQVDTNICNCSCKNGKFVSGTGVLDKTALCDDCIHPIYLHDQFTGK